MIICLLVLHTVYESSVRKCTLRSITVSNGVRQGGVLRPYLFSLYMDDLSRKLNSVQSGCFVGSSLLNNLMFADDLCVFSPASKDYKN